MRSARQAGAHAAPRRRALIRTKDVLWWIYLYPLRGLAAVLPPGWVRSLGSVLDPILQVLTRSVKQAVRPRMALALGVGKSAPEVKRAAEAFVRNAVFRSLDDLILNRLVSRGELPAPAIRGLEHLGSAQAHGRGVIVISGHFYANRVAKRYLAEIGHSMMSVRHDEPPDSRMGRIGKQYLQPRYIRFLETVVRDEVSPTDESSGLVILRRLRANGLVNIHLDAAFSRSVMKLPFLDRTRKLPVGFLEVVRLTGASIVPMLCLGNSREFTIRFDEPVRLGGWENREEFVAANLPKLAKCLGAQIVAHPDEWELWARI